MGTTSLSSPSQSVADLVCKARVSRTDAVTTTSVAGAKCLARCKKECLSVKTIPPLVSMGKSGRRRVCTPDASPDTRPRSGALYHIVPSFGVEKTESARGICKFIRPDIPKKLGNGQIGGKCGVKTRRRTGKKRKGCCFAPLSLKKHKWWNPSVCQGRIRAVPAQVISWRTGAHGGLP